MYFADKKFLEFFFKRVKVNNSGRYESEFPYLSPCGRETNYIHCDDLPIVFSQLLDSQGHAIQDISTFGRYSPDDNPPDDYHRGNPLNEANDLTKSEGRQSTADKLTGVCTPTNATAKTETFIDPSSTPIPSASETVLNPLQSTPLLRLAYGGTLSLTVPFQPSSLCMLPSSGRVYHSGLEKLGGVGLVKSSLAIELSRFFVYGAEGEGVREGEAGEGVREGEAGEGVREGAPVGFRWQGTTWPLDSAMMLPRVAQFTNVRN